MRPTKLIALSAASVLTLSACGGDPTEEPSESTAEGGETSEGSGDSEAITVGSANFTESTVVAEIYALALEDAGIEVEQRPEIGSRETYIPALEDGSIDLIPEYTGTLATYYDEDIEVTASDEVYAALQEALPEDLTVLEASEAENADNVVVTSETAEEFDLETISDLEGHAQDMTLGGPPEWQERAQGVPGLEEVYGLEFASFRALNAGGNVTVQALVNGQVDAANVFTTDPAIPANDLVILEDDQDLFSAQNVVPLISADVVNDTVTEALNGVSAELTSEELTDMLTEVQDGAQPDEVAQTWAEENL